MLLAVVLTSTVLLILTSQLLKSRSIREASSHMKHRASHKEVHSVKEMYNKQRHPSSSSRSRPEFPLGHNQAKVSSSSSLKRKQAKKVSDTKVYEKLWNNFHWVYENHSSGTPKDAKLNSSKGCNDTLCIDYLSDSDVKFFFQCLKNATRRLKKILEHQNTGSTPVPFLSYFEDLGKTGSKGILASGSCRFMNGKGK